jgi:cation/acetate symporter
LLALLLTILSPTVWENVLGYASAPFPYTSPTLFSLPLAFFTTWIVSLLDRSERGKVDRAGYAAQRVRSETGIGASRGSGH